MSNAKHTLGPWSVDSSGPDFKVENKDIVIARICGVSLESPSIEAERANARLIAAAPDLLEALIALEREKADYMRLNNLGDPAREHNTIMARSAIAKATGETK